MNKLNHRSEPSNHISKIQQSIKEMKQEVEGFLKKHSKNTVPPILKGRHYLLVDSINNFDTSRSIQSPRKLIKDLSSEALSIVSEGDKFQSLRNLNIPKKQANKVVKQKRTITGSHNLNKVQPQQSCLLPNICNIRIEHNGQSIFHIPSRRPLMDQKTVNASPQKSQSGNLLNETKRYRSIDLYRQSYLDELQPQSIRNTLRGSKLRWLQRSITKHLFQDGRSHHTLDFNDEVISQKQSKPTELPQIASLKETIVDNLSMEQLSKTQNHHLSVRRNIKKSIARQTIIAPLAKVDSPKKAVRRIELIKKQASFDLERFDPWENQEEQLGQKLFFEKDLQ